MGAVAIAAYRAAEAAELSSHAADFAATGGRCFGGREDREAPLPVLTLRVVYDLVSLAAYRRDLSPSVQRTLAQLNGALGYGGGGGVRTLSLLHL